MAMNGPEHYIAAQEHLDEATKAELGSDKEAFELKAAHVHAMLAVAASNIDTHLRDLSVVHSWNAAMGVHRD